ncbi:MAG: serine acetyltransferase [Deltaproteobacteria bacterium]|nr:MAG: serine acetyltransferase [Deltaproteobacteria bacterium]
MILPQKDKVAYSVRALSFLLFPHHLSFADVSKSSNTAAIKKVEAQVRKVLSEQISRSFESQKKEKVQKKMIQSWVADFFKSLPEIRQKLLKDAQSAADRDPAVESLDEVIMCYPGFQALMIYRLAHELAMKNIPFLPRMMSEMAHTQTGCDIHPGAKIGEGLFIDHATGVVIGQTAVIGNRVTIFQGVTLGAIAIQEKSSPKKRHPTIEDDVILYSHATILGGDTVIGKGAIIGGSCWITFSVPPHSKVILANPRSLLSQSQKQIEQVPNWDI